VPATEPAVKVLCLGRYMSQPSPFIQPLRWPTNLILGNTIEFV